MFHNEKNENNSLWCSRDSWRKMGQISNKVVAFFLFFGFAKSARRICYKFTINWGNLNKRTRKISANDFSFISKSNEFRFLSHLKLEN